MTKQKDPFTETEKKVMQHLVAAQKEFSKLEVTHPADTREWTDGIHDLQRIIQGRIVRRDYPDTFYSINKDDKGKVKKLNKPKIIT